MNHQQKKCGNTIILFQNLLSNPIMSQQCLLKSSCFQNVGNGTNRGGSIPILQQFCLMSIVVYYAGCLSVCLLQLRIFCSLIDVVVIC